MIVVIAPEHDIPNELDILQQLFEEGLEYYHFRKPHKTDDEHGAYIRAIDEQYRKCIVTHYYHEQAERYGLKGIHLQEQFRRDKGNQLTDYVAYHKKMQFTVSSSYHDPDVLGKEGHPFDYHLLSPVFNAISKAGYEGKGFDVNAIDKTIVGMGGVNAQTIPATLALGYKGIGVLGGVWNSDDPVQSFREIKKTMEENE